MNSFAWRGNIGQRTDGDRADPNLRFAYYALLPLWKANSEHIGISALQESSLRPLQNRFLVGLTLMYSWVVIGSTFSANIGG
jgi:hypothetical protein